MKLVLLNLVTDQSIKSWNNKSTMIHCKGLLAQNGGRSANQKQHFKKSFSVIQQVSTDSRENVALGLPMFVINHLHSSCAKFVLNSNTIINSYSSRTRRI